MPQLNPREPPPSDYYAANLRVLLAHVLDVYRDLLTARERAFVDALLSLPPDPQRLYARLLGRKGPWVRADKLVYREIDDLDGAIEALVSRGLVSENGPAPADVLLGLLTQAERAACFPKIPRLNRAEWIAQCVGRYDDAWIRRRLSRSYRWVGLSQYDLVMLCQLLFFGDDRQDTSTFVLQDLGVLGFEQYRLRRQQRMFADRSSLDRFRALRYLAALSHRLTEHPGLADWIVSEVRHPARSRQEERQRDRILNRIGLHHERGGALDRALEAYGSSRMHPARERRARILRKLEDTTGTDALVQRIGATPRCAEEIDFAARFGRRGKRTEHEVSEVRLASSPQRNIEAHAAELIAVGGARVFHLENVFPLGVAGLAFWDVIFADVPGAFTNPFQMGPLDLFWPDFAAARADLLARRRAELADPATFRRELETTFRRKQGVANRLVSWRHFDENVLDSALTAIPAGDLLNLADYVIRWPYRTRTGFPDLTVIYGPGNHEFVEVKGPTDQLQPAQRVWLTALRDMHQRARVLKFKAC